MRTKRNKPHMGMHRPLHHLREKQMQGPVRSQTDGKQDDYSANAAIEFHDKHLTRQEHEPEQNINTILDKFGVNAFARMPDKTPIFTETDYGHDLQDAYQNLQQIRTAHSNLPDDIRKDYPTWQALLIGIEKGDVVFTDEQPKETENTTE